MTYLLSYCTLGAFAGIMAGLLGVGGGLVIVPVLTFLFAAQHFPADYIVHLALGTSLASIMFTSISSMRAHHGRRAVDWFIVKRVSLGIMAGAFLGSWMAAQLSTRYLKVFFVIFLFNVATQMFRDITPNPRQPFGTAGMLGIGSLIGGISGLVGIGGGTMSVPFMLKCNVSIHNAIGTSAAIGFPIALAGAVGYAVNGLMVTALPPHSLGFIYLPALLGISLASVFTAPLGARLAHSMPVAPLKKVFAGLLVVVGVKMLLGLF